MKHLLLILSIFTLSIGQICAQEKNEIKVTDQYAFGYATSLSDTVVYLTEISNMPVVTINKKNGFLIDRASYTYQLKEFMKKLGHEHATCAIIFSNNRKKISKRFISIMNKLQKKNYFVKTISAEEFTFKELTE